MLFSRFPALWFGDTSSPMDMADPGTPQTCLYSQKAFGLSSNPSSPQPALDWQMQPVCDFAVAWYPLPLTIWALDRQQAAGAHHPLASQFGLQPRNSKQVHGNILNSFFFCCCRKVFRQTGVSLMPVVRVRGEDTLPEGVGWHPWLGASAWMH